MADFQGRRTDALEAMRDWNTYFGEQDRVAQSRWQDNETRQRYDEANRYNRAEASRSQEFFNRNAHLFNGMEGSFAELRRRGASTVAMPQGAATGTNAVGGQGPLNITPNAGLEGPAPGERNTVVQDVTGSLTPEQRARLAPQGGAAAGMQPSLQPTLIHELTQEQRVAWRRYLEVTRTNPIGQATSAYLSNSRPRDGVTPEQAQAARAELQRAGLDVQGDRLMRRVQPTQGQEGITTDATGLTWPGNVPDGQDLPEVDPRADLQAGTDSQQAGLSTDQSASGDPFYDQWNDTSRGLVPTREMGLIRATVENNLERARLAAQHGRNDVAAEAFGSALQGQASYIQQGRMIMLRSAANGNLSAAADLIGEFNGYPQGTVRLSRVEGQQNRIAIQIQNESGEWVTASSVDRTQMFASLQNLVDAEGAQARQEASNEMLRARMESDDRRFATMTEYNIALVREAAETGRVTLQERARYAIARGQARMEVNQETGAAYIYYPDVDANGEPTIGVEIVRMEDLQTPDSRGNRGRTEPTLTRTPAIRNTGTNGVTVRAN